MAAKSKKAEALPRIVELNASGMTVAEACVEVGVHPVTASKWFREEGITPVKVRTGRRADESTRTAFTCEQCGVEFEDYSRKPRRFCSLDCTNEWQVEHRSSFKTCPCGKRIELQEGASTMHTYRKYCSAECRKTYGKKRQADPANSVTFACQTCGVEVTRYKNYGNGASKFCSNVCAARHTKTVRHYVVRDSDVVLDSGWEALFWGLCALLKVPCERIDRAQTVEWSPGHHYAPDFTLPGLGLAVEVKGVEDTDDSEKWLAWREQRGSLVILDRGRMDFLRAAGDRDAFAAILSDLADLHVKV